VPQVIDVCPLEELQPGDVRLVEWEDLEIGVFNCAGTVYAIEDRCSHDNGPLVEGELDQADCTVECPRHGSRFDLKTGQPKWSFFGSGADVYRLACGRLPESGKALATFYAGDGPTRVCPPAGDFLE